MPSDHLPGPTQLMGTDSRPGLAGSIGAAAAPRTRGKTALIASCNHHPDQVPIGLAAACNFLRQLLIPDFMLGKTIASAGWTGLGGVGKDWPFKESR